MLRRQRFEEIDLERLIEKMEAPARDAGNSVRSHTHSIIEHFLKLEHSPSNRLRSAWRPTIRTQRDDLLDDLTLTRRRDLEGERPEIYRRVCRHVAAQPRDFREDEAASALPETCPSTLEQITGDWLPGDLETPSGGGLG